MQQQAAIAYPTTAARFAAAPAIVLGSGAKLLAQGGGGLIMTLTGSFTDMGASVYPPMQ